MHTSRFGFLGSRRISSYESEQKSRLLHYMLIAVFIGGLVNSLSNYLYGWMEEALLLSLLTLVCLAGFYLNAAHHFEVAGWLFCVSFYIVITFLLYQGIGLYDTTLLAFPIFTICTTFLFGQRGLFLATLASIVAVLAVYRLAATGFIDTAFPTSFFRAVMISFLFAAMAMVIWIVRRTWETTLALLNESYDQTLRGWARALEFRDGETAGHSQRVTQLSLAVGKALGLQREDLANMRRGAYLHDIGKMAIPDTILLKPGPLTEAEWQVMKQHPVLAREFLLEIPFLQGAMPITYSHHEHWDGSGYPEGLQGEDIPLLARIFTVIDNWDALTSERPYRKAWSKAEANAFLRENSGKLFDPKVVDVFLAVIAQQEDSERPTQPV